MHEEVDCEGPVAAGSDSETNDDIVDSSSDVFQYVTDSHHDTTQLITTSAEAMSSASASSDYKVFVNGTPGESVCVQSTLLYNLPKIKSRFVERVKPKI